VLANTVRTYAGIHVCVLLELVLEAVNVTRVDAKVKGICEFVKSTFVDSQTSPANKEQSLDSQQRRACSRHLDYDSRARYESFSFLMLLKVSILINTWYLREELCSCSAVIRLAKSDPSMLGISTRS